VTVKTDDTGTTAVITPQQKIKAVMQIFVSALMLTVGVLVLTAPNFAFHHNFDESTKKWAAGWVGAIIGYWLS
jgi:type IV secretory pathway VirB6-like protein